MPVMQKLSYAGKHLNDSQRTLQQWVPPPPRSAPLARRERCS